MKNLQHRLNQLYEQQAIEEKKVMESINDVMNSISPFENIKKNWNEFVKGDDSEAELPKQTLTLLLNKTIDNLVEKPAILNQSLKVLLKNRVIDVLFEPQEKPIEEKKQECVLTEV